MDSSSFTFTSPKFDVLAAAIRRFPAAMLAALCFAIISILETHKFTDLDQAEVILFVCFASFFALLATELVAEAKGWAFRQRFLACAMVLAAVVSWSVIIGTSMGLPHWLFGFALFGFCVVAPAFGGASNDALWQFNQQSFLGLGIAGMAALMLVAGASAILYALASLFGLESEAEWFGTAIILAFAVFWPVYTITFMPKLPQQLNAPPMMPLPLAFVLSFVALPVLLVFGALVAAYGISVLLLNASPIASVGWMVMGFSAAGIALHFLLYPMRASGNFMVRWFEKNFFLLLIPMLGLLFWAVLVRVGEYGITENRYMALLGGLWALAMAALVMLRRGDVKLGHAPTALAVILAFASLGPWSAESVSYRSQNMRLQELLTSLNILQPGGIVEPGEKPEASWELRNNLSSLLDYFKDRRDERLPEYLVPYKNIDHVNASTWGEAIMRKWQLRYIDSYDRMRFGMQEAPGSIYYQADEILFGGQRNGPLDISGYNWLLPFSTYPHQILSSTQEVFSKLQLSFTFKDDKFLVVQGQNEAAVDVMALLPQPLDEQEYSVSTPMLVKDVTLGTATMRLLITNMTLERKNAVWHLNSVSGYVLFKQN